MKSCILVHYYIFSKQILSKVLMECLGLGSWYADSSLKTKMYWKVGQRLMK